MPAYVIVDIEVKDPAAYEEYKRLAPPAIAAFGGRYLARGGASEVLEGTWAPRRLVILEFPTVERAKQWWGSREYGPAKTLRQVCADADMVVIEGVPT
jgi:uncharacterized protein (DUF1330 family)